MLFFLWLCLKLSHFLHFWRIWWWQCTLVYFLMAFFIFANAGLLFSFSLENNEGLFLQIFSFLFFSPELETPVIYVLSHLCCHTAHWCSDFVFKFFLHILYCYISSFSEIPNLFKIPFSILDFISHVVVFILQAQFKPS